jgi:hypothetical protein
MKEIKISKSLRAKISDAFGNTGIVYWQPASYASAFDLRTVTYVYENGKERSKSICKLEAKANIELIAAIQKTYPKILGFAECLESAFDAGKLPLDITIGEIKQLAGVN